MESNFSKIATRFANRQYSSMEKLREKILPDSRTIPRRHVRG